MKSIRPPFPRRDRGSALITALMFTILLSLLIASVLTWSMTERRLNTYNARLLQARNAAEAVAEYGAYQVQYNFNNRSTPLTLDPTSITALTVPPASFFGGADASGAYVDTSAYSSSNPTGMQVIGSFTGVATNGAVPSTGNLYYVNPSDPDNATDTLVGQYTTRRDVQILAKATVVVPNGPSVTAYVTETVSVRGSPLFANAIFYSNNDLEVFPGGNFDIYGPVHVNGNIFASSKASLNFHGPVSITGNIYHAWASANPAGDGTGSESLGTSPVTFINSASTQVNLLSGSTWDDSTMGGLSSLLNGSGLYINTSTAALTQLTAVLSSNFRTYATQTWSGNLQTSAMGVQSYNPVAFTLPIDSAGDLPDPHSLINPPANSTYLADTTDSGAYTTARDAVETQKFSTQSGLYVLVTVTPGTSGGADTATINLYGNSTSGTTGATTNGPNGGILIASIPANTAAVGQIATFIPYQASAVGNTTTITTPASPYSATSTTNTKTGKTTYSVVSTTTTTAQPVIASYNGTSSTYGISNNGTATSTTSTTTYSSSYSNLTLAQTAATTLNASHPTATSTGTTTITGNITVSSGLYDQRQTAGVDLVQIDMSAIKTALSGGNSTIADYWNGGVYVDVESSAGNNTYPGQTSVITANSLVAKGSSMLPTVNNASGITIATNGPLYILGNFNADGNVTTTGNTSATTPDDGKTDAPGGATSAEVPAALAADSITILSANYFGSTGTYGASVTKTGNSTVTYTNSSSTNAYSSYSTTDPTASGNVEIAAAFITGLVATTSSASSGGVHNLPRFLENWGNDTVAIRGSLTSLYNSEVANAAYKGGYYSPPTRLWGFDQIFANGVFPPITPKVVSYRRSAFTTITATSPAYQSSTNSSYPTAAANYNAQVNALWPGTNPSN